MIIITRLVKCHATYWLKVIRFGTEIYICSTVVCYRVLAAISLQRSPGAAGRADPRVIPLGRTSPAASGYSRESSRGENIHMSDSTRANAEQRRAADPAASAFVAASAGSGKTKLLTDRLLRLMPTHGSRGTACRTATPPIWRDTGPGPTPTRFVCHLDGAVPAAPAIPSRIRAARQRGGRSAPDAWNWSHAVAALQCRCVCDDKCA